MNADDSPRGTEMQNDFHFKCFGFEVRAIGRLAILAAIIVALLIFSPAREGFYRVLNSCFSAATAIFQS